MKLSTTFGFTNSYKTWSLALAIPLLLQAQPALATVTFLNTWGSFGSGNGQFFFPHDVAIAPTGQLYVADRDNHRLQRFSAEGTYETQWGTFGTGNGQLNYPTGVAVSSTGQVYVAEGDRIQRFSADGNYQLQWGSLGTGDGQFDYPYDVAVSPDGHVYVADSFNDRIQRFDADGSYQLQWGTLGTGDGQFNSPRSLAVAPSGKVYISEPYNRIQRFTAEGAYETQWGTFGNTAGEFDGPYGVDVAASGQVYVSEAFGNRIQRFDAGGIYETQWGTMGSNSGEFYAPEGLAVSPAGLVYVADRVNNRIQRFFDPDAWAYGTNSFVNGAAGPTSVSIGPGGIMGVSLTLDASKELVVGDTTSLLPGGTLTLNGGKLTTETLDLSGGTFQFQSGTLGFSDSLVIGTGPLGTAVTIENGQTIDVIRYGWIDAGASLTVQPGGTFGAGIALINSGDTQLGGSGAKFVTPSFTNLSQLRGRGLIEGTLANFSDGNIFVSYGDEIRTTGTANYNDGRITLGGGAVSFDNDLSNNSGGLIFGNGTLRADGGLTNNGNIAPSATANIIGDVSNSATGLITSSGGTTTFFDDVVNNGEIRTNPNSFTVYYGSYSGNGDTGTGTVIMEGDLQPGFSPGIMAFGGELSFGQSAGLEIELGGTLDGNFDRIEVAGDIALNGSLDVQLFGGFVPNAGDTFEILTAGGLVGSFDSISLPSLPGDLLWFVNQTTTSLELVSTYAADFDEDGDVDDDDLAAWDGGFGSGVATHKTGDANFSATANGFDFLAWQRQRGYGGSLSGIATASIPEPSALILLIIASAFSFARLTTRWYTGGKLFSHCNEVSATCLPRRSSP